MGILNLLAIIIISAFIGVLAYIIADKYFNRIYVKLIRRSTDHDVNNFIDLYESRIHENIRISPEEIVVWIEEEKLAHKQKNSEYSEYFHYLYVCKIGKKVAGFLKAMYHSKSKMMFIAYFGINKSMQDARRVASLMMLKKLNHLILNKRKDCRAIIFEIEDFQYVGEGVSQEEIEQRKARLRLFKELSRRAGYTTYQVDIDYLQPKMTFDENDTEERMLLLYTPIERMESDKPTINKKIVIDILYFIFMQIYLPTFRHDKVKQQKYHSYLSSLLNKYMISLPEEIALK